MILLLCTGCSSTNAVREETSNYNQKSEVKEYPYANSTDIYTPTSKYAIDGTNREIMPFLADGFDYSILYVNDKWFYYYEADDEGTGILRRIPLHKGKNGRDILEVNKRELVRDTQYETGFTIVDNFYAGISYGTTAILYNIDTRQSVRQGIPEELLYPKKMELEDKQWFVLEQSSNWILWEGNGIMLQKIPSGEMMALQEGCDTAIAASNDDYIIYSCNNKTCYQYDIKRNKKTEIATKGQICKAIAQGLDISQTKIDSYSIDQIMMKDYKIYLQLRIKIKEGNKKKKQFIVLSRKGKEEEEFLFDSKLNSVLKRHFVEKENKTNGKTIALQNMHFLSNIGKIWFMEDDQFFCYNESTGLVKKIDQDDKEWNIFYAVCEDGLEENYFLE